MKLPVSWLKEYIQVSDSPEKLAERLTMSGTAVEHVHHGILEIEVTTNRPDCLSILGLAREIAALTGKKIQFPKISKEKKSKNKAPFQVKIEDKKGCAFYTARLIQNVRIQNSPEKIIQNLSHMGSRAIHNAVDATNFVLFEMGHPLHAFDYDKIAGHTVIVRRAYKGEKFLGIDGIEYVLGEETLVIADAEKAIAIAGVIGGKATEVTASTKNILLEAAVFDQATVRQAAKKYKISTESSYRFERGVNRDTVTLASRRATDLIVEWTGGSEGAVLEISKIPSEKQKKITVRVSQVDALLGFKVPASRMIQILKNLGIPSVAQGVGKIVVTPPSFRRDITQEADLIEEILRIEGFDKVPSAIPITRHVLGNYRDKKAPAQFELKKFLAAMGFQEIITYSFLSKKAVEDSGFTVDSKIQKIMNPVSADLEYFRPSLFTGALQTVLFNAHRKVSSLKLFEIGNRHLNGKEETVLGITLYGASEENWQHKQEASFYDLKGIVENIFHHLQIAQWEWKNAGSNSIFDDHAALFVSQELTAGIGKVSGTILKKWDLTKDVFYTEIILDRILSEDGLKKSSRVQPVPKFPSARRDVAFVLDRAVPVESLANLMRETAKPFVKDVTLFDQYIGKNIPAGKRSLAFSLEYQKENATFTDEEINGLQRRVMDSLKERYQVEFRS